ncbi:uncharacterized protein LOC141865913 isoform X3 [Acropora palmata]|uniref:uncharacterized protein LOC141865913 isoform X3 n=1 Tax=Acropora palmata TaxID=6131 RepID=UPI003DA0DFCB
MPPRLFESLFRNAELSDSGEEQDSQERKRHLSVGAIDAKESHKSSSDAMFDETVDLSCADVKTEGSGTHFSDCAFQTQIKQLAMEDKSIIADICPMRGPLSGGNPFYISLKECLPEDILSGFAIFGAVGTIELIKLDNFKFFGLNIPPASSPGKVQTSDGQCLGSTVFTYVDKDKEVFRQFIASDRLRAMFFSFSAQELAMQESKTEQDGTSKCSNPERPGTNANILHLSGQSDFMQILDVHYIDDLDNSSGCSLPIEERGGSIKEASESFRSNKETEISLNMGNKDEACKAKNSASDQCRQAQYSREAGEESCLKSDEIPDLEGVVDEILPVSGSVEAASSPGMIAVKVQTSHGQYLGATVFTYVDEDQEVLRRLITSDRIQSKFFSFLAQELSIRESKTKQDETSKCSNSERHGMDTSILHLSGQSDLTQMMEGLAIDDLEK